MDIRFVKMLMLTVFSNCSGVMQVPVNFNFNRTKLAVTALQYIVPEYI